MKSLERCERMEKRKNELIYGRTIDFSFYCRSFSQRTNWRAFNATASLIAVVANATSSIIGISFDCTLCFLIKVKRFRAFTQWKQSHNRIQKHNNKILQVGSVFFFYVCLLTTEMMPIWTHILLALLCQHNGIHFGISDESVCTCVFSSFLFDVVYITTSAEVFDQTNHSMAVMW